MEENLIKLAVIKKLLLKALYILISTCVIDSSQSEVREFPPRHSGTLYVQNSNRLNVG
jgi:hypothetical protein